MRNSFHDVLEETVRNSRGANRDDRSKIAMPKAPRSLDIGPARCGGGEARWGLAMSWTAAQDETMASTLPPAGEAPLLHRDAPELIAAELGIGTPASAHDLRLRWRTFVWRNHPDRQPAGARERANARVAIANSLYQSARRQLRQAR